jgi:ATP-binding cassette subfamily B multidrug efflux pump
MSPRRRLLAHLIRHRSVFARGLACVPPAVGLTLAGPWVLKLAIDDLATGVTEPKLWAYATAIVALSAFAGVFRFLMRRVLIGASREFEYALRHDFFAHLQRMDVAFFQRHRTGDLMARATNDLNAVRMMMGPAVMYSASTGLTFAAGLALMLSIDRWLTLVALVPLPFVSVIVWHFGRAIHDRFRLWRAGCRSASSWRSTRI